MSCLLLGASFFPAPTHAATLKINGSTTINPVIAEAAEVFRQKGWQIFLDTQGGSSGGISYLADGRADIGMVSRELHRDDQKKYPGVNFTTHVLGYDGVALVVSKDLFDHGVTSVSKQQLQMLYEGKIKNWKDIGGPDRGVVFFNKEPGRGTWEVFANYLYGDSDKAPKVFHPEVGANQEARTKVANHKGGITQLSASWAWNRQDVHTLRIREDKTITAPNMSTIADGSYPLRRPLLLVTKGAPQGAVAEFIAYLMSAEGQKIVTKHGYLSRLPQKDS